MRTIIVVALLASAGCKDKAKDNAAPAAKIEPAPTAPANPPPTPTEPPKDQPPPPDEAKPKVLELGAAKLTKPDVELSVDPGGKLVLNGKEMGIVTPTGELTSKGNLLAEIDGDGNVSIMGWGPGLQLAVRADGAVLDNGKIALEPKPDGTLVATKAVTKDKLMPNYLMDPGQTLKLDGDKKAFRAVVFAYIALTRTHHDK
jgi:hypothetical protein